MEKTAAVTVCLLWLLLLLAVSTPASSSPPTFLVPHAEAVENTWATKQPIPEALCPGVAVVNDILYAIGGAQWFDTFANNEQYTPFGYGTVPQRSEPFPVTWIVAAIVIIAAVGVAILVYFVKVKKTTGKAE